MRYIYIYMYYYVFIHMHIISQFIDIDHPPHHAFFQPLHAEVP